MYRAQFSLELVAALPASPTASLTAQMAAEGHFPQRQEIEKRNSPKGSGQAWAVSLGAIKQQMVS